MIEIHQIEKSGFCEQVTFKTWKTAFITFSEDYAALRRMKRHLQTDEVVTLIRGEAVLHTLEGEHTAAIPLEIGKTYNIKRGTWHHVQLSPDGIGFVVENSNTTKENTEVKEIADTTNKGVLV